MIRFSLSVVLVLVSLAVMAQKPVLGLPIGHSDAILCAAFSPDGQYILTGSKDRTAKLWTRKGKVIRTIQQHDLPVHVVTFSPRGNYFATRDKAHTYLWSMYGELLATFGEAEKTEDDRGYATSRPYTNSVQFSPDDKKLLIKSKKGPATLYFIEQKTSKGIPNTNHFALDFSEDGKYILSEVKQSIKLFDDTGEEISTLPKSETQVNESKKDFGPPCIEFVPGRNAIVVAYGSDRLEVLDFKGNQLLSKGNPFVDPRQYIVRYSAVTYPLNWSKINFSNTGKYWNYQSPRENYIWATTNFPDLDWIYTYYGILADFSYKDEFLLFRSFYNERGIVTDLDRNVKFEVNGLNEVDPYKDGIPDMPYLSFPLVFAPDSNQIFAGFANGTAALMDMEGAVIRNFDRGPLNKVLDFQITEDQAEGQIHHFRQPVEQGDFSLLLGAITSQIQQFDLENGAVVSSKPTDTSGIMDKDRRQVLRKKIFVSKDEQFYLEGKENFNIQYEDRLNPGYAIDPMDGVVCIKDKLQETQAQFKLSSSVNDVYLSDDHKHLFVSLSYEEEAFLILDFPALLALASEEGKTEPWTDSYGDTLGRYVKYLDKHQTLKCLIDSLSTLPFRPYILDHSTNSNQLLYASYRSPNMGLIDLNDQSITEFKGHQLQVKGAKFFKEEAFVLSWSDDFSVKVWEAATGKELATLFFLNENDWVVTTPSGLFDATDGAKDIMYYVVDLEIVDIEQLEERFYTKGLLHKLFGYSPLGLRQVAGFDHIELYPKVAAEIVNDTLKIRLKDQGGGIGKATIFLNGKERTQEANPLPPEGGARDSVIAVPLGDYFKYVRGHPDSTNTITIRAYNEEGWLRSRPYSLEFKSEKAAPAAVQETGDAWKGFSGYPNFYGVVIGTNKYNDEALRLSFADQDAASMAVALQEISQELYGKEGMVEITCLSTTPIDSSGLVETTIPWKVSSKENIKAVFDDIATKAQAKDVLVVYFSGHGMATGTGEKTQFYYLTKDLTSKGLKDPVIRDQYSVSSTELTQWMNVIPAAKGVVILDACNSGAALNAFNNSTSKDLSEGAFEAINRMKYRTGTYLIAGSAPNKLSYESKEYGQGLLTYAILKGMLEAVVSKKDGKFVDVTNLFEYAWATVPTLAESVNGVQRPMIGTPKGTGSFDIGMITDDVKIPIRDQNQVLKRCVFLDSVSLYDELGLIEALESRLQRESDKGLKAKFLFMDANSYKNAFSVSGMYVQKEGKIHLRANLIQNDVVVHTLDTSPAGNVDVLSRQIVLEIKDFLKTQR